MIQSAEQFACVIWGGYALGNTGDELCLAAAVERAKAEFGERVAVLSHRPEFTEQLFPEVAVIRYMPPKRRRFRLWDRWFGNRRSQLTKPARNHQAEIHFDSGSEWVRVLSQARRLYLAGGGYLTDLFPVELFLPPIQLAAQLNIPVTTAPLGLGPFKSSRWADRVADVLRQSDLKVRDASSLAFCQRHGLAAILEPDAAFALVRKFPAPAATANPAARPRKIGVCIHSQAGRNNYFDEAAWWIQCLRGLQAQHPECEIEGFCFHTSPEEGFDEMKKLFFQAGLSSEKVSPPVEDFRRAVAAIRSYDLIIATRFHATVVANAFGIPNLAVASGDYYLAKMQAATSGYETASRLVNPADFAPGALLDLCRQKLSGHHGRGVPVVEPDNSAASPTLPKDEPRKTFGA